MSGLTFSVKNFRALREVRWEIPEGLSTLVGPNGSGKSTLLAALGFFRDLTVKDLGKAIQGAGGLVGLRHFDLEDAFIEFEVVHEQSSWKLSVPFNGPNADPSFGEVFRMGEKTIFEFEPFSRDGKVGEKAASRSAGSWLAVFDASNNDVNSAAFPLLLRVGEYVHWRALSYNISYLRRSGSAADSETVLSSDGKSVWSVLRNWRDKRETLARYEFVKQGMRDAFPENFEDLDFEFTAQQVSARIYVPDRKDPVPHHLFSDGWFTGLLHLCAIASASKGAVVSVDEPENSLHPHAIRSLLRSIGAWAEQNELSVILATHSPVVLNQIKDRSRVFVMETGHAVCPVPLDEHPNHEWLSHFSIGDAYANEEVGAPRATP